MKKKNLVLSFLLVASISSAVGCSNNKSKKVSTIQSNTSSNSGAPSNSENTSKHVHNFNKKNVDEEYLASSPTCTEAVKYYYSCECGEKGEEKFSPYGSSPLGHQIDQLGRCSVDGCKECYTTDVSNYKEDKTYTAHDGKVYLCFPNNCSSYFFSIASQYVNCKSLSVYLGSNPTEDISNKFTFTEGKATLSQYIYDEDIYVSIDVGEEITNVPVSFASSSMNQEHNFPAMANLSIVDGIATKTCVVCHKGTKQAICENEITTLGSHSYVNSNGLVQIPVKFDHPVRLDLKFPNGKVYCQVFDKETKNSLNYYVVDGEEIIVLDGEKDNNIEVNFSEFTLLNEGDSVNLINGSAVFKMKRPETETKILDLDEDKYYSHFYCGNKYKSYCSTEQIDDEYIYCYVGTDDDSLLSSSITARFKDHTHVFTNNKCTCGLNNRFEVYGNTNNYLVVGLNEIYLYNNIISGSKVTIETNSNDLIEIFDKDSGELITKGYRTVTYVRPTSKTYICKINNTEINKSFSVREIA